MSPSFACCHRLHVAIVCTLPSFARCHRLHVAIVCTLPSFARCHRLHIAIVCMLPSFAHCHRLHVAVSHTLPTSNGCHLHAAISHMSPLLVHVAISRVVPMSDSCHLRVTVDCVSPLLAHVAISRVVPMSDSCHLRVTVDCVSPSLACHRQPHGAPEQCPSPAHCCCLHVTVRIAIGHMVPLSDARYPHIAVNHASPSLAHHRRPHGVPEQCLSPARRRCLHITIRIAVGHMVPTSNACHLHVAVACASLFASLSATQCP